MPLPPWSVELLRRSLSDVAAKANPESIERLKTQAIEILGELPAAAARGLDSVISATEATGQSLKRWTQLHTGRSRGVINATGVLFNDFGTGVPIDADVLEAGLDFLDHSRVASGGLEHTQKLANDAIGGGDRRIVFTSHLCSAVAAIPTLIADRELVIHRSQAISIPSTNLSGVLVRRSLPEWLQTYGFQIRELGGVDPPDASDFSSLKNYATVFCTSPQSSGFSQSNEPGQTNGKQTELFPLPGDGLCIELCRYATTGPNDFGLPSISTALDGHADLVIAGGGAFHGGPNVGIIAGSDRLITALESSPIGATIMPSSSDAAMAWTAMARDPRESPDTAQSLMMIGIENLRSRAERLATRLGAHPDIAACRITDEVATLEPTASQSDWSIDSRQVRIKPNSSNLDEWVQANRQADPGIYMNMDAESNEAIIDLRWVRPQDDAKLFSLDRS